jgi:ABC-2 type transport system ATP-binding protein
MSFFMAASTESEVIWPIAPPVYLISNRMGKANALPTLALESRGMCPELVLEIHPPSGPVDYNQEMTTAIYCSDLRKQYPARPKPVDAVNGLDLEVPVGECFGLLGPNGAGKTTTIEILEGLLAPTSGEVLVLGQRWGEKDDALRQRLGISLQETRLAEKLTVLETIVLFRSFYKRGQDAAAVLEYVRLTDKAHSYVGKLSGGQKQRLAAACALVGDPELLFLDEPTMGLDPHARRQLWEILRDFKSA